jgi:hypothetical protein
MLKRFLELDSRRVCYFTSTMGSWLVFSRLIVLAMAWQKDSASFFFHHW